MVTEATDLNYIAYHRVLTTGQVADIVINCSIRTGPGWIIYTYQQEQSALSYVYLQRHMVGDNIYTDLLHMWATHTCPITCLPTCPHQRWPPPPMLPSPPLIMNMRHMTCIWSNIFTCSLMAVWKVHVNHTAVGAVLVCHDKDTHPMPGLLQPHTASLLWNCWMGWTNLWRNWSWIPGLLSSWTTCRQSTPIW